MKNSRKDINNNEFLDELIIKSTGGKGRIVFNNLMNPKERHVKSNKEQELEDISGQKSHHMQLLANLFSENAELSHAAYIYFVSLRNPEEWRQEDVIQCLVDHLDPKETVEHQRLAVIALGKIRDARANKDLLPLLDVSEEKILECLPSALGNIGGEEITMALINKLTNTKSTLLQNRIAHALKHIGDRRAEPALLKYCQKDIHQFARDAVFYALGTCGTEKSAKILLSILHDYTDTNYTRLALEDALYLLQERNYIPQQNDIYQVDYFLPLEAKKLQDKIRRNEIEAIPIYLDHINDIGFANQDFGCPACDGDTIEESIILMGQNAVPLLIKYVDNRQKNEAGKVMAISILGKNESESTLPVLLKVFQDSNVSSLVRSEAAVALGSYQNTEVLKVLMNSFKEANTVVQAGILFGFRRIRNPKVLPLFFEYLAQDSKSKRKIATYIYAQNYDIIDLRYRTLPIGSNDENWKNIDMILLIIQEIGSPAIRETIKFLLGERKSIKEDLLLGLLFVLRNLKITADNILEIKPVLTDILKSPQTEYHRKLSMYFLEIIPKIS